MKKNKTKIKTKKNKYYDEIIKIDLMIKKLKDKKIKIAKKIIYE